MNFPVVGWIVDSTISESIIQQAKMRPSALAFWALSVASRACGNRYRNVLLSMGMGTQDGDRRLYPAFLDITPQNVWRGWSRHQFGGVGLRVLASWQR